MTHPDASGEVQPNLGKTGTRRLDPDDLRMFYEVYHPELIRFLLRKGASAAEAEDAAADTLLAVMRLKHRENIQNLRAYLFKIALNVFARTRSARRELLWESFPDDSISMLADPGVDPAANMHGKEMVLEALQSLPSKQRDVMALLVDGYTPSEIASIIGLTAEAVRQNIKRGRQSLRTLLQSREGSD